MRIGWHTPGLLISGDQTAAYEFTAHEIDELEAATDTLHAMSLEACRHAIQTGQCEMLGIPPVVWPIVEASCREGEPSLYGRMDLRYDGKGPPTLLEYNADMPTALYEAAVIQWEWLSCARCGRSVQFDPRGADRVMAGPRPAATRAFRFASECGRGSREC